MSPTAPSDFQDEVISRLEDLIRRERRLGDKVDQIAQQSQPKRHDLSIIAQKSGERKIARKT